AIVMAANSPSQTLKNSADAMSKLKSFHATFQSTEDVHTQGNGSTYTVNGTADAANSNQMQITLSNGSQSLAKVVSTGQEVYAQRGTGSWYKTTNGKLPDGLQKYLSQGLPASVGQFLSALQNAKLVDKGQETPGNTPLDHITATLDPQSTQTFTSQLNGMLPSQWQSNQNQIQRGVVDLWIDPATSYLHQMTIDAHAQVDQTVLSQATGQSANGSSAVPVDIKGQVNLSKFDQTNTIQVPKSATPYPSS
ncbi:MAG TPA: hypothetical protein VFV38_13210, partial [Ktedonobacteraceae bacterium]|nr:hypothetical protein [Ktedonobacteraceae bacterium]